MSQPLTNRITPLLSVKEIEPCLNFWERLGFEITIRVPETGIIHFAALQSGQCEVMYQTVESVKEDLGLEGETLGRHACLYINTSDIDALEQTLKNADVVVPKRTTFYGATEIFVREPGGHVVGFAQQGKSN